MRRFGMRWNKGKALLRPSLRLIGLVSLIVPRRLREDWRREWEAELRHHESLLIQWRRSGSGNRQELLRHSLGSLRDALMLQPKRWEEEMVRDLRYGGRMLLKHKGFTAVAVLALSLGIGANTALFSLVDAVLLKALPVKNPEELVLFKWVSRPKIMARGVKGPPTFDKDGLRTSNTFSYAAFERL